MTDEETVGFVAKVQKEREVNGTTYYRLQIPGPVVQYMDLEKGELLQVDLTHEDGEEAGFSQKTGAASGPQLKIYIGKSGKHLDLEQGDLIKAFISRK